MTKQRSPDTKETGPESVLRVESGDVFGIDKAVSREALFHAIAHFTYDWETWVAPDGKPHWINPAVERISGYSVEECYVMEGYPLPMIHPDDRALIASCLSQAADGKPGNDVEFKIAHKFGKEKWGAVSWQTISDETGTIIGYRTSVRDITLRKQMELALRKAQQTAERASAEKSRFLAAASHDLRQPIQAASMFTSALLECDVEIEKDHIISGISDSLEATRNLLDALLDVSRLDAGTLDIDVTPFAIADLLEQIETEFEPLAQEKELTLKVIPSSCIVTTDAVMLLRMLRNLVSNAVRYTEQGKILIGTRRLTGALRLDVHDTGIGIEVSKLDDVFEDFYQVNNPERDRRRGLGLGLSVVRRKAKLLDLDISVKSALGMGSRFSITVPLASGPATPAKPQGPSYEAIDIAGRTVLYIDDDPVQLDAMTAILRQWGVTALCAMTEVEAVECILHQDQRPNAIIADYRLRENKTGASAIKRVLEVVGSPIPAVLLTGDTEPARIVEATASGYVLLHKPVSPSILKQTLHDVMTPAVRSRQ